MRVSGDPGKRVNAQGETFLKFVVSDKQDTGNMLTGIVGAGDGASRQSSLKRQHSDRPEGWGGNSHVTSGIRCSISVCQHFPSTL